MIIVDVPKKKREPNKWQLYLSSCFETQPKSASMGEKVSACSITYKDLKNKDPKKLEDIIELAKSKKQSIKE